MKDYYYILGIKKGTSVDEIKKAYRKLSLKFHPDKNDGDEFFTERFKEIQEAYETLSDINRRAAYDTNFSDERYSRKENNGYNFDPIIEFFKVNKISFEYGEEITFNWKTINSDKVTIKPFGTVQPIGQKTYRIKDFKNPSLTFQLIAENSNIGRRIHQHLTLNNRTFQELYSHFKKIYETENRTNNKQNNDSGNKNQRSSGTKYSSEYKIVGTTEKSSVFGGFTKIYKIEFFDGKKGEVFLKEKNNHAYFKDRKTYDWNILMHHYESLDTCINALHYFLETSKKSKEGFIETYS